MNEVERTKFWNERPELVEVPRGIGWGGATQGAADVFVNVFVKNEDGSPMMIDGKSVVGSVATRGSCLTNVAELEAFQADLDARARQLFAQVEEQLDKLEQEALSPEPEDSTGDEVTTVPPPEERRFGPTLTLTEAQKAAIAAAKARKR